MRASYFYSRFERLFINNLTHRRQSNKDYTNVICASEAVALNLRHYSTSYWLALQVLESTLFPASPNRGKAQ
jgi:hypothetical protein